jgi:hypothetical protein
LFGGGTPGVAKKTDKTDKGSSDRPSPPKASPSPAVPAVAPSAKPALAKASLFGDDDDAGGGLFAPIKPVVAASTTTATTKGNLLGGEDDLFSSKPKTTTTVTSKSLSGASLFGGSSPSSDLFSTKPAVLALKPTPSVAEPVVASPLSKSSAFSDPLSGSPKSKIAALGAGINFNPAMLAGGRPAPKAAPVAEARLTEDGLEISNAGARLGDEATQGAKSKVLLFLLKKVSCTHDKSGHSATQRRTTSSD